MTPTPAQSPYGGHTEVRTTGRRCGRPVRAGILPAGAIGRTRQRVVVAVVQEA
ncbi:hypothetical protein GCM10010116_04600 [Microbispora rosea subsp. aerata]|nr:hypothetical protein [Microbispora rosea]GGO02376.1 hypothetical protein GCM10010116_04600 [Microbispora rosea subsp. aerata]GIH54639.1 hypothetical protein Mro02_15530 [Microbispora rosea subsp. aerata]GLJ87322.1 hypothetical protein GCM10017588_60670 [Microbispora rosea subsp. aerata]